MKDMFLGRGRMFAAAVLGASMFFGCGGECRFPEKRYESLPSSDTAVGSSDREIIGYLKLLPFERSGYDIPNRYQVVCGVKSEGGPFDILVSKHYKDGNYELVVGSSGAPSRSIASNVLEPGDLEGVVDLKCSVSIPEKWKCEYVEVCEFDICHVEDTCSLVQRKKLVGALNASLVSSEECFDWYYDDPNIVRDPGKLRDIKSR